MGLPTYNMRTCVCSLPTITCELARVCVDTRASSRRKLCVKKLWSVPLSIYLAFPHITCELAGGERTCFFPSNISNLLASYLSTSHHLHGWNRGTLTTPYQSRPYATPLPPPPPPAAQTAGCGRQRQTYFQGHTPSRMLISGQTEHA